MKGGEAHIIYHYYKDCNSSAAKKKNSTRGVCGTLMYEFIINFTCPYGQRARVALKFGWHLNYSLTVLIPARSVTY